MCIKKLMSYATASSLYMNKAKKMGPIYWSLIFFPAQCRVIENLLIHIRKKSAYVWWNDWQESTLNCHNWLKTYVLNTQLIQWFSKKFYTGQPLQFSILKKWFRFYLKKFYLVSFKKYPLFDRKIVVSKTYKILNV